MSEFLNMGGYAAYIWPAYGASALVMLILLVASLRGLKADENTLKALQADNGGRRHRPAVKAPQTEETVQEDAS